MLADNLLPRPIIYAVHPVFWLESVAVIAFGVSWLIKGETFLQDLPEEHLPKEPRTVGIGHP